LHGATRHLKAFFKWLSQEVGYKSRIKYSDAEYFNISEKDARTAKAKRQKPIATIEQVKHTLALMPDETTIQKRDKALIAFTLLTGARDSAIASFKIKHIDLVTDSVYQDAREVKTKFSKTFHTYFFPVGGDVRNIVADWVTYLKQELLFGNEAPLFPKTQVGQNETANFQASGVINEHWSSAAAIRKIFKGAFMAADLPTFNPHSFRNTLASLGETICRSPEEFKAWSQNLGHEGVLTTFYSYGDVQVSRQADLFKQFKEPRTEAGSHDVAGLAKALALEMANQQR
jgi:integrase/recombinase XerD